jgi:hypothetical protein
MTAIDGNALLMYLEPDDALGLIRDCGAGFRPSATVLEFA